MPAVRFAVLIGGVSVASATSAQLDLSAYDVEWTTPSADAVGSMPIGNGELVLNVWVEAKTGDLLFYLARTDALSEASRYLKLGRIRVKFDPDPWPDPAHSHFRQRLRLRDGRIEFEGRRARLHLAVDPENDVVHLVGDFGEPTRVEAEIECWRNSARAVPREEQRSAWSFQNAPFDLIESADRFQTGAGGAIVWFHRNETSYVPRLWQNQSLEGLKGLFDPLLHRTFGGRLAGRGMVPAGERTLRSSAPSRRVELEVATAAGQTRSVSEWLRRLELAAEASDPGAMRAAQRWWNRYWAQSWVEVPNRPAISKAYLLQRYMQAIQGRGAYPIKFNGGFATVEPKAHNLAFDPDWRQWGDAHWFQNLRHMYHPMLASGDWDMMEPFWRLYESARPLAESRAKRYHGVEGAYFPETMTLFGTYAGGDYGWNREGLQPKDVQCPWWDDAWNQGPELVCLMLDRWDYTRDARFLSRRALPMAVSVLKYFDTRFAKTPEGKIVLDPTQVVETYWTGVQDDMPCVAGLRAMTERLCALPPRWTTRDQRALFARMRDACPDLPLEPGKDGPELAPARRYDPKISNVENGELYAIWPFRLVTVGRPALAEEAKRAYAHRLNRLDTGWGYDGNVAALLGLADEASRILGAKAANSHPAYRWPATWGPNFDWLPDQNHGGNLLNTAHLMLLQADPIEAGGAIRVLPAWPKEWDADCRLVAPGNTWVRMKVKAGRLALLEVLPKDRRKDVRIAPAWQ